MSYMKIVDVIILTSEADIGIFLK